MTPKGIERAIIELLEQRHPRSACPSEIARQLEPQGWRAPMVAVSKAC